MGSPNEPERQFDDQSSELEVFLGIDWSEYFVEESGKIYQHIYFIVLDYLYADDIFLETFKVFFEKIDAYDPAKPLTPWLKGIARYTALNYMRRIGREVPMPEDLEYILPTPDPLDAWQAEMETAALFQRIRTQLQLSDLDFEILCHYFYSDLQPREIALMTGLASKTISNRLSRIRGALKALDPDDFHRLFEG